MTQTRPSQLAVETTVSALREKSKLRRHFRRFDMLFFLICTVMTLDTIGAVASNGAQGFTWLLFLAVFFFLPYSLCIAELGSAFPQEGGPYVWTRLAFGRPAWRSRPPPASVASQPGSVDAVPPSVVPLLGYRRGLAGSPLTRVARPSRERPADLPGRWLRPSLMRS
jgi:hypothetical protein